MFPAARFAGPELSKGKFSGLCVNVDSLGSLLLTDRLADNGETEVYLSNRDGVLAKTFNLECGKTDEVSYGPYMEFALELANFEEINHVEELRAFVPAYYGAHLDYERKFGLISMEYLAGRDLTSWCLEGASAGYPTDWVSAFRETAYETLGIMRRFHKHGIVLIDFKPDDILRFEDGRVKFVDLGAFFTPRHLKESEKFVYSTTPDHAELVIDSSNVPVGLPLTKASDIFSAGVALFEMATGSSRLSMDGETADEILRNPAIYLFRNSQIRDVWRANPELKDAVPLLEVQLKERRILFSEFWHLLKGYLTVKMSDWATLEEEQQQQIILTTGTTFILEQLPAPLQWLAGPIARTTTLRGLRLTSIAELMQLLQQPASYDARDDLRLHNGLVQYLRDTALPVEFIDQLNSWEVRRDPTTGHWAVRAPLATAQLGENASFTFLKQTARDESGNRFFLISDDLAADDYEGGKLAAAHLPHDHHAWIG